ncbi:major facilitator superfamily transporter [Moesziomyces antarcticus]|uniref:Related to multidrug resistance proteins n=1 Tax=Pseudozyma antarctica TaxID=84753 RepID=A0A5C3FIY4_PSEA2|nr:major facilitator superfamily transporter [Moesziomyces antarcticus]GAK63741.1 major facilitator superfamily transporter [Moesziomyces antarcticus]SPO44343.1 related to multidrug resistance proteins [Moesziomyces antarcticus]
MAPTQSERTPLLGTQQRQPSVSRHRPSFAASIGRPDLTAEEEDAIAQESAFSAIQGAAHGVDPNSSAFVPLDQSHFSVSGIGGAIAEEPEEPPLRADIWVIMGAMWIGSFLAALDGTIVATIMNSVGSEFRVSKEVGWLGTSYLLTQTAFQPLYGRASDIFGRKAATLFASVVFLIGSLLCGLSQTFWQLCAARAIAGIGGGGLTTMATLVTSDLVSLKARGTWQGLGNLVYATGAALGGPLGGALADGGLGWRWAFLVQVPLCAVHFAVVSWKIDIPAGPGSMIEKIKRIDALGSLSLVTSVTLILVGLSLGGNEREWSDKLVLGSLIGGGAVLVLFVLIERYVAREPLMPMSVLFNRTPGFVAIACWFITMSQFGIIFNVPTYFQSVEQTASSYAGLHLIPNAIIASSCSLGSGLIMARTGRYRKMLLLGGLFGFLGPLMMCFWHRGTSEVFYWATMPFGGAAYGSILTITLVALIASVDPKDMAAATGVTYLFRATGSVLGISLSSAILQNSLQKNLEKTDIPRKVIQLIRQDAGAIKELSKPLRQAAIGAYEQSMHTVFIAIAAAGFFAFLALFFIEERDLPGKKPAAPAAVPARAQR